MAVPASAQAPASAPTPAAAPLSIRTSTLWPPAENGGTYSCTCGLPAVAIIGIHSGPGRRKCGEIHWSAVAWRGVESPTDAALTH